MKTYNYKQELCTLIMALFCALFHSLAGFAQKSEKPNILFIIFDHYLLLNHILLSALTRWILRDFLIASELTHLNNLRYRGKWFLKRVNMCCTAQIPITPLFYIHFALPVYLLFAFFVSSTNQINQKI